MSLTPIQPKSDVLQALLDDFSFRTTDVLMAMVTTRDGLSVASARKETIAHEEDMLAVAASRILDMSLEINEAQLNQGELGRILIEGEKRTTIIMRAGRDILLVVIVPANAKLGLAMVSMRKTAQSIAELYH
jgi:predicted regulator of Ras-like GTPase activity (Roadblock/LC7/MglB family)